MSVVSEHCDCPPVDDDSFYGVADAINPGGPNELPDPQNPDDPGDVPVQPERPPVDCCLYPAFASYDPAPYTIDDLPEKIRIQINTAERTLHRHVDAEGRYAYSITDSGTPWVMLDGGSWVVTTAAAGTEATYESSCLIGEAWVSGNGGEAEVLTRDLFAETYVANFNFVEGGPLLPYEVELDRVSLCIWEGEFTADGEVSPQQVTVRLRYDPEDYLWRYEFSEDHGVKIGNNSSPVGTYTDYPTDHIPTDLVTDFVIS